MARHKTSVTIEVPGLPPSANNALVHAPRRTFPTKEYRAWKKLCKNIKVQKIKKAEWYGVEIFFHFPLYYKNGNVMRKDRSNYIKYAEDELCKKLVTYDGEPIDDKLIKTGVEEKIDSDEVKTVFTIYCM